MRTKFRLPRSRMALSALLNGVALLAGAQVAFADTPAHPASGVLTLSNVRVEAASANQIAEASRAGSKPAQSGFRAYKDPITGELRDQTPEEMMDAGTRSKSARTRAAKSGFASPRGGVGVRLDESFMSNAVVVKDAEGKNHMQCVTSEDNGKAHRHDH
jgi:hypothetical protein